MTSTMTLLRRFGPWRAVLARAGHADRYSGRTVSPKMRSQRSRTLTDAEIIAELQRVAAAAGTTTLVLDDVRRHSETPRGEGAAVSASARSRPHSPLRDCSHAPHANRWTEEDHLENLRRVWAHSGRAPSPATEMSLPPSRITATSYRHRFGSWDAAKRAAQLV